jgi:translation initiation factor 2 alpha subunit (eIF-2alpha)
MTEEIMQQLDEFVVKLELSTKQVNELLNMMNQPLAVPSLKWAEYIKLYQDQAGPQVEQAKNALEAVAKANNESETAS